MISIFVFPNDVNGYIWGVDEWLKMRTDYRVIGKLVGKSSEKQRTVAGLPVLLLSEEVTLLIEKGYARVVQSPFLRNDLDEKFKICGLEERRMFADDLKKYHIEKRRKELEEKIDFIIEGKKKKSPDLCNMDKQKVIEEELEKTILLCEKNAQFMLTEDDILIDESKLIDAQWIFPTSEKEQLRYDVFKDLWEKNYRLTCGDKFGGDFLCYEGDPIQFHATYIIVCRVNNAKISCKEFISLGRVGTSTRKIVVIASKNILGNQNEIVYQCLEWISDKGSERLPKKSDMSVR